MILLAEGPAGQWPGVARFPVPFADEEPPVIARTWHGMVPADRADAYALYLQDTGIPDYEATPGNLGVSVLRRADGDRVHFLLVSLWDSYDSIRLFAGEDVTVARYYPDDTDFLLELEPRVIHYDVLSAPAADRAQPEALRARALTASLTARDLRASMAWYRDVVGFTVEQQYEREGTLRAVSLKAGAVSLLLSQDDGAKGLDRVKGEGFSLQLSTAQSVDMLAQRIRDAGGRLESEPEEAWGARVFRIRDPDGFRLTISSTRDRAGR